MHPISSLAADGVERVTGAVSPSWVEQLRTAADEVMASPSPLGHELSRDREGRYFSDMYLSLSFPVFGRFLRDSEFIAGIATRLGWSKIVLLTDELLVKEPRTTQHTPWHHDLSYWPVHGTEVCSVWLPLDPVAVHDGGLEFVRGSHHWDPKFQPVDFDTDAPRRTSSTEVRLSESHVAGHERVSWPLIPPGDGLLFHARTLHRASGNSSSHRRRRVLVVRLVGENVRYDPRPRTLPVIWGPNLAPGAPLWNDAALFPTLWERPA